jgi:hypothetical protein
MPPDDNKKRLAAQGAEPPPQNRAAVTGNTESDALPGRLEVAAEAVPASVVGKGSFGAAQPPKSDVDDDAGPVLSDESSSALGQTPESGVLPATSGSVVHSWIDLLPRGRPVAGREQLVVPTGKVGLIQRARTVERVLPPGSFSGWWGTGGLQLRLVDTARRIERKVTATTETGTRQVTATVQLQVDVPARTAGWWDRPQQCDQSLRAKVERALRMAAGDEESVTDRERRRVRDAVAHAFADASIGGEFGIVVSVLRTDVRALPTPSATTSTGSGRPASPPGRQPGPESWDEGVFKEEAKSAAAAGYPELDVTGKDGSVIVRGEFTSPKFEVEIILRPGSWPVVTIIDDNGVRTVDESLTETEHLSALLRSALVAAIP